MTPRRKHAPATVIGYARVSTEDQAAKGVSLDAQRHRLEAYCEAHGLRLVRIEEDAGISARKTTNRPALQRALAALTAKEAGGLVAIKLDRVSRTTRDVLDLVAAAEREGWALHSIDERLDTSSPQGRFVVTVLGAIAQLEREQAAERTKMALRELQRQGRAIGGRPPFGFKARDGRLVKVPKEQAILKEMLAMYDDGARCWRIAKVLNERGGVNPRTGRAWFYGTVGVILRTAVARRERA